MTAEDTDSHNVGPLFETWCSSALVNFIHSVKEYNIVQNIIIYWSFHPHRLFSQIGMPLTTSR